MKELADVDFFKNRPLDKSIPMPMYFQLMEILQDYINSYDHGFPIPTENELCGVYEISRPTVRQAINELVMEGLISRQKGRGSFISKRKIAQDFLLSIASFNDEMQAKGLAPETKVLNLCARNTTAPAREKLELKSAGQVVYLSRLRSIDGEPVVLVNTCLPYSRLAGLLEKNFEKESLYHVLDRDFALRVVRTVRTLELRAAGSYEAGLLGIPEQAPLHYIETVGYTVDGTPVEFSVAYYRADRNKFTIEVRVAD